MEEAPESNELTIQFHARRKDEMVYPKPSSASDFIPRWYKNLPAHPPEQNQGARAATAKSCSPFMDTMRAGYIIPMPVSVTVRALGEEDVGFDWNGNLTAIESHHRDQLAGSPYQPPRYFKFINPWVIETPPGYSCLFIAPMNHGPTPYTLFSGVVETDRYPNSINFPFWWNTFPFDGVLEAGTPMVQVIPFRREEWNGVIRPSTEDDEFLRDVEGERVMSRWQWYKRNRHVPKRWRFRQMGDSEG